MNFSYAKVHATAARALTRDPLSPDGSFPENPSNICINLTLPEESRVTGLHFCRWWCWSIFIPIWQIIVVGSKTCAMAVQCHQRSLALRVLPVRLSFHLSVCPSVPYGLVTRKTYKNQTRIEWNVNFQLKRSKVKVTGRRNPQKIGFMFTYGRPITPLLSLIYCQRTRRLTTGRTAALSCRHSAATRFLVVKQNTLAKGEKSIQVVYVYILTQV